MGANDLVMDRKTAKIYRLWSVHKLFESDDYEVHHRCLLQVGRPFGIFLPEVRVDYEVTRTVLTELRQWRRTSPDKFRVASCRRVLRMDNKEEE